MFKIIFCETNGGLGNRLENLVNALWLREEFKADSIQLRWSNAPSCGVDWASIFKPIDGLKSHHRTKSFLKLIQGTGIGICHSFIEVDRLLKTVDANKCISYCNDIRTITSPQEFLMHLSFLGPLDFIYVQEQGVFKCLSNHVVGRLLKNHVTPQKRLLKKISDFCQKNNINRSVSGIHVRATDKSQCFEKTLKEGHRMVRQALIRSNRVFLCTDSEEIETILKNEFKNRILTFPKQAFVKKIDPQRKWGEGFNISEANKKDLKSHGIRPQDFAYYNVFRSKEQIEGAVCDMFLLSRTSIPEDQITYSTFLNCAKALASQQID